MCRKHRDFDTGLGHRVLEESRRQAVTRVNQRQAGAGATRPPRLGDGWTGLLEAGPATQGPEPEELPPAASVPLPLSPQSGVSQLPWAQPGLWGNPPLPTPAGSSCWASLLCWACLFDFLMWSSQPPWDG